MQGLHERSGVRHPFVWPPEEGDQLRKHRLHLMRLFFSWTMWRRPLKHRRGSADNPSRSSLGAWLSWSHKWPRQIRICCVLPISGDARGATCAGGLFDSGVRIEKSRSGTLCTAQPKLKDRRCNVRGRRPLQYTWVRLGAFSECEDDFCEKSENNP